MRETISNAGIGVRLLIGVLTLIWIAAILTVAGQEDLAAWLAALGADWLPAPGWTGR